MTEREFRFVMGAILVAGILLFGFFAAAPWLIGPLDY